MKRSEKRLYESFEDSLMDRVNNISYLLSERIIHSRTDEDFKRDEILLNLVERVITNFDDHSDVLGKD